jgi:hypothetical protein
LERYSEPEQYANMAEVTEFANKAYSETYTYLGKWGFNIFPPADIT